MKSNNGLADAARNHLRLLRTDPLKQNDHYVTLAANYGVTVPEIVELSGLKLEHVRKILDVN
jgi:hypothetical protein